MMTLQPPTFSHPPDTIEDQLCCSRSKPSLFHTCVGFPACTARFATIVFRFWPFSCQQFIWHSNAFTENIQNKTEMSASRRMMAVWKLVEYSSTFSVVRNIPKVFLVKKMLRLLLLCVSQHRKTHITPNNECFFFIPLILL